VIKLGREVKPYPLPGPLQGHATDEQHHQDEVWEGGCEVHDLRENRASWESREQERSMSAPPSPVPGVGHHISQHHPAVLGSLGCNGDSDASPASVQAIPEVAQVRLMLFMGLAFPDVQALVDITVDPPKRPSSPHLARGFDSL